jgi:hypothetical protein
MSRYHRAAGKRDLVLRQAARFGNRRADPLDKSSLVRNGEARWDFERANWTLPSADTPTTGVVFVIGDTTLQYARLGGKRGTLAIKNAAAFRTIGEGDLSDTQVIIGGTGDFIGATGSLRISGTFVSGSGTSSYEGTICVP